MRANHKLTFRFFGLFQVIGRVGEVAYRLQLPEQPKIHLVIHVSQLCTGVAPSTTVMPELPVLYEVLLPLQVLAEILQRRTVRRGVQQVEEVLLHWSGFPSPWPLGKMKSLSKQGFRGLWLGDKLGSKGGGMSWELPRAHLFF